MRTHCGGRVYCNGLNSGSMPHGAAVSVDVMTYEYQ